MSILVLGVSHRTAPLAVREAVAFSPADAERLQRCARPAFDELIVLSTCHRVELYAAGAAGAHGALAALWRAERGAPPDGALFQLEDSAAVRHLLRVGAGLDSMVLGEPQILGQVRGALARGRECGSVGAELGPLFDAALHAGRRVRAETDLGGAGSVASSAVARAERSAQGLAERDVVLVGAGDTARLIAGPLVKRRPRRLRILNRNSARAEELARETGGEAWPLERLGEALRDADVAFFATSASQPLLTPALLDERSDPSRRLVVVDVGMPRNVAAGVAEKAGVVLHSIDSLADAGITRSPRQDSLARAEAIVAEEVAAFLDGRAARGLAPVVRELREHFERVRADELNRLLPAEPAERERAERLTRSLVNKLLHQPTVRLKQLAGDDALRREQALRELFGLRGDAAPPGRG